LKEAESGNELRTFVAHGNLVEYEESADHLLTFMKMDPNDDYTMHEASARRITVSALLKAGDDYMDLSSRALDFGNRLAQALVPEHQSD
jgi:hypothetical protein